MREERSLSLRLERGGRFEDWIGREIKEIQLPGDSLIALIRRGAHGIIPHGGTELQEGDRLTVIAAPAAIRELSRR